MLGIDLAFDCELDSDAFATIGKHLGRDGRAAVSAGQCTTSNIIRHMSQVTQYLSPLLRKSNESAGNGVVPNLKQTSGVN